MWKGDLQLTGKNVRFGHSCVFMSLSNAIEAWKYVRRAQPLLFMHLLRKPTQRAQQHFPRLTMIAIVKMWGNATTTTGEQQFSSHRSCIRCSYVLSGRDIHISAEFSCSSNVDNTIRGSFFFDPILQPQTFSVGDVVKLDGIEMQEWNQSPQLSGKNVQISAYAYK